ncbi:MAG: RCC1 domain-containing protein [Sandaracinaceae bacterium]
MRAWVLFVPARMVVPAGLVVVAGLIGCAGDPTVVVAGNQHSCELRAGRVHCWGADDQGQLGLDGHAADRIAAGGDTTCVVAGGTVRCVGRNHHGQLGDGRTAARAVPFDALEGAVDVSVGFAHVCALAASGAVWCWGWNGSGQAGAEPGDIAAPRRVDLPPMDRVAAGFDTTCAFAGHEMRCWGALDLREEGVNDVALGADHVCALRDDGLTCWGAEPGGGGAALETPRTYPLRGGAHAAGSIDHLCFTDPDGRLYCLGKNTFGQLGRGDFRRPDVPSPVFELAPGVRTVAVGAEHSCAVAAGQTWCWGWNRAGQLGKDDGLDSAVPVVVPCRSPCSDGGER